MSDIHRGEYECCEGIVQQLKHELHTPPWHVLRDWQEFNYQLYIIDLQWAAQFGLQAFSKRIRTATGAQELITMVQTTELRIPFAMQASIVKRFVLNRFTTREIIKADDWFEEADHYFWNGLRHREGIIHSFISTMINAVYILLDVET
jgi:hypothetical protein